MSVSLVTPPAIARGGAGRAARTLDEKIVQAFAAGLEQATNGQYVSVSDTFDSKLKARGYATLVTRELVRFGLLKADQTNRIRTRVWVDGEKFRVGLRVGEPRAAKVAA